MAAPAAAVPARKRRRLIGARCLCVMNDSSVLFGATGLFISLQGLSRRFSAHLFLAVRPPKNVIALCSGIFVTRVVSLGACAVFAERPWEPSAGADRQPWRARERRRSCVGMPWPRQSALEIVVRRPSLLFQYDALFVLSVVEMIYRAERYLSLIHI